MTKAAAASSILIVDDTVENLRLLSSMLSTNGYEVRPVTNGQQALLAAATDPPDLILLDITMPDMDGYEVCSRLKSLDGVKDVPVIFLTALTDTADKVKAFGVGGADYVTKPFQIEEVLSRVNAHVALARARTELQASYGRLQELEHLRDDLVHMIVHDMRSPLAVMLAHLDLVVVDAEGVLSGEALDDIRMAARGARALNHMANDLLDVSKLEQGKMRIERASCDLVEVAREVCGNLGAWDRGRKFDVAAEGPVKVACDGQLIRRVLENLVSNAIKHTPAGGEIRVLVAAGEKEVRVAVEDQGPGVPPEARTRIFEKFETASARKDGTYHSVGLGLAFCKLAVEAHGGTIGVDSGKDRGSVFWFALPN